MRYNDDLVINEGDKYPDAGPLFHAVMASLMGNLRDDVYPEVVAANIVKHCEEEIDRQMLELLRGVRR
jgi:hypothetical protein